MSLAEDDYTPPKRGALSVCTDNVHTEEEVPFYKYMKAALNNNTSSFLHCHASSNGMNKSIHKLKMSVSNIKLLSVLSLQIHTNW